MDTNKPKKLNPNPNPNPNPSSMRVLLRPSPPQPQPQPPQPSTSTSSPPPPPSTGVVVVGFIGRRHSDISNLLNLIIDSDVFGPSRRRDTTFHLDEAGEDAKVKAWFDSRRISYYYDHGKGIVFVQLSSILCPAMSSGSGPGSGFEAVVDDCEFGDLQSMLFMFTVCHVIVYVQEGSRFDTHILKILRVLQSAKHGLTPFLRSHSILPSLGRPSTSSSRPSAAATSSKSPSPRRGSSISNRNNSPISVMSGLGSYTALFPGQCTPITLFAFIDDLSEMVNCNAAAEDSTDASSSSRSGLSSLVRSNQPVKGSSSVVMLSRAANKSECSLLKKLQTSLEAQIRFLIKKCRVLSSCENSSHVGSRSSVISSSAPLLMLDSSRAVVLLDSCGIQRGKSLDFATGLLEDVLSGKVLSDSLLLESHSQCGLKEDVMSLKDFVFRQADILRGKGGLVTNANSGSAAGVGMVAVAAAAAAAASAASGRATGVPELPSLEMWLSSCQVILKGILSGIPASLDEADLNKRRYRQRNGVPPLAEGIAPRIADPPDTVLSLLESGKGINRKFSALWCQRALPAAMEVYLKDLPPCYPTSLHEAQLEKALRTFHSLVKGPSVREFMTKLEEDCLSIWMSGRQLCDAVSLTGKPCMHQRHDIKNVGPASDAIGKEHNSGFVFLHACACGRSRKLRADPFDFESANIKFNVFSDCDNLLPMLQLPKINNHSSLQLSSWTVVRLGSARYYEPTKGLLQAGFSPREKFLLRWTIVQEKNKHPNVSFANALRQGSSSSKADSRFETTATDDAKKTGTTMAQPGEVQAPDEGHGKFDDTSKSDQKKISFGRGLPNVMMKKAFSEVVAGSTSSNSAFPPLQLKAQLPSSSVRATKKSMEVRNTFQISVSNGYSHRPEKSEEVPSVGTENTNSINDAEHDGSCLHIGSNVVPLNVDDVSHASESNIADVGKSRFIPLRHFVVYVGFEHECPYGHRFILPPELLNQLGQPYSSLGESHVAHPVEYSTHKHKVPVKIGKSESHKASRSSNGNSAIIQKVSNLERSIEFETESNPGASGTSNLMEQKTPDSSVLPSYAADLQQSCYSMKLNDNGPAYSLLNRNLPIYLKCPYCKASKNKKVTQNLKFAGTISQLQRIFVVTPPFPIVLATNPIIQFEGSLQPAGVSSHGQPLQFSLGCQVILPPESCISIRLPFVYGNEVKDKGLHPLKPCEHQPELTAWIMQGTALQVVCKGRSTE